MRVTRARSPARGSESRILYFGFFIQTLAYLKQTLTVLRVPRDALQTFRRVPCPSRPKSNRKRYRKRLRPSKTTL